MMIRVFEMGFVMLAIGAAFWFGTRCGPQRIVVATQPRAIEIIYRDAVESNNAAALRDCNDALAVWSHAPDYWATNRNAPGLRFYNPEGEVVTYHLPPPRRPTGPGLTSSVVRVHREAGVAPAHIPAPPGTYWMRGAPRPPGIE